MLRTARVLIVEDKTEIRNLLRRMLEKLPRAFRRTFGIDAVEVDEAGDGKEAEKLLNQAIRRFRPYDVMVLDLGLPNAPGGEEDKNVGLKLLKKHNEQSCECIVVLTRFDRDVSLYRKAMRAGVADFVSKNSSATQKLWSVGQSCQKARLRRRRRWIELQQRRVEKWLLLESGGFVADRMARVVREQISAAHAQMTEIAESVQQVYCRTLRRPVDVELQAKLDELQQRLLLLPDEYARQRDLVAPGTSTEKCVNLNRLIDRVMNNLRPGIVFRGLTLERSISGKDKVSRVVHQAAALIEELAFSAIRASKPGMSIQIASAGKSQCRGVAVTVADSARRIRSAKCGDDDTIQDGRGRSLTLVQHLASGIGGRLDVTSSKTGNCVTLHLPVFSA